MFYCCKPSGFTMLSSYSLEKYLSAGGAFEKRRRPPPEAKIFGGVRFFSPLREKVKNKHCTMSCSLSIIEFYRCLIFHKEVVASQPTQLYQRFRLKNLCFEASIKLIMNHYFSKVMKTLGNEVVQPRVHPCV